MKSSDLDMYACCGCGSSQALFAKLGDYKLGPAMEARAEVLSAEAGDDASKQVSPCDLAKSLRMAVSDHG